MGTFIRSVEALLAVLAASLLAAAGYYARRKPLGSPVEHAVTYWAIKYREVDGQMLNSTVRVMSVDARRRSIQVWSHYAQNGYGHERSLDVDRFIEAMDLRTGAAVDARQWLASRTEVLAKVRRISW